MTEPTHDLFGNPAPIDAPDDHEPPAPIGFIAAMRTRRRLVRPAGRFIGFGREAPDQPDLFEATFRVGWCWWDIFPPDLNAGLVERIRLLQRLLRETRDALRERSR